MKYLLIAAALYGAVMLAAKHADYDKALELARKNPQASWAPALDYYLGALSYQRSDYPNTKKAFTQLLTDYPTAHYAPKALLWLGDAAEKTADWELARDSYKRYVQDHPDGKDIEIVRKRLELLNYNRPPSP